jgi:hypothetical protein
VHDNIRRVSDARADIIGLSDYAYQRTRSRLAGLTDDEYFKASLVLHQLDEHIHHGAELGVLRDLYLHDRAKPARSAGRG